MSNIKDKAKDLPEKPGIYIMMDAKGDVLYVGKAISLKKRVSSYFFRSQDNPKTRELVGRIADIKYFTTKSEIDALILECSLIKRYRPKYNIEYIDDKSYPFIKITKDEFPSITVVRIPPSSVQSLNSSDFILFGPYPKVDSMRETLHVICRVFPVRSCSRRINSAKKTKVCLDYHVGLCSGPCQHLIDREKYKALVKSIYILLKGEKIGLIKDLKKRMVRASKALHFEDAAKIRNQISGLMQLIDVSQSHSFLPGIRQPGLNARRSGALQELKEKLKLDSVPQFVEGFDISNISGSFATGSVVVFKDGIPYKNGYRHFGIKTVKGANDVGMLAEIAERRYKFNKSRQSTVHGQEKTVDRGPWTVDKNTQTELPDLILVDGGVAQLKAVAAVIKGLNLKVPVISLAKKYEEIYTIDGSQIKKVYMPLVSAGLQLLQHVRDEAHRFAIQYHKLLRDKEINKSRLDEIKGIGMQRKKILFEHFGSLEAIREASVEDLKSIGIPSDIARQVLSMI